MGDDNKQTNTNDANQNANNVDDNNAKNANQVNDQKDKGNMIPKSRFDQVNTEKKEAIEALQSVADQMVEDIPEEFRDLVPKGLKPAAQISWIRKASAKGLFNPNPENSPDSKRPNASNKQTPDLEGKSPTELISMGVGELDLKGVEIE